MGSVTSSHLEDCAKYKEALADEMADHEEKYDFVGGSSPPGAYFGVTATTEVTPLNSTVPPQKKARTTKDDPQAFAYSCFVCGETRCMYDSGYTVLVDDDGEEFDPDGDLLKKACSDKTCPPLLPFKEVFLPIRMVVDGLVRSKGIWSAHKYIGNPRLDTKLKTWMRNRLQEGAIVDSPNWAALRHSVKETLRYKRQRSVHLIRTVFMSKYFRCFLFGSLFVLLPNNPRTTLANCFPSNSPPTELEGKKFSGFYRRHLLQFGSDHADLSKDATMATLSWVICHFVPLVVDDPRTFWQSMLAQKPLEEYMTNSDLAFAFVVLEHYMMNWRRLILFQWETGQFPSAIYSKQSSGFLYKHGIAGEAAKKRFGDLCLYFFSSFSTTACPTKKQNTVRLQNSLNRATKMEFAWIKSAMDCFPSLESSDKVNQLQDDIAHRVFYYLYL